MSVSGGNIEEMTTANVAEACSSKAANVGECSAFVLKMRVCEILFKYNFL